MNEPKDVSDRNSRPLKTSCPAKVNADSESDLKAAFAELHRRRRDDAPPFASMREVAMSLAHKPSRHHARVTLGWRLASIAAIICVVAAAVRWGAYLPDRTSRSAEHAETAKRVDTLLSAIEQHLEQSDSIPFAEYPTDMLLAGNEYDLPQ